MKIIVNGAVREVIGANLKSLLDELGFADAVVATACNGEFVPVTHRATTLIAAGDRIEILAPTQGG